MDDRLRPLWDFDDLDATEKRFPTRSSPGGSIRCNGAPRS